jgi:two-component system chemotaxis response regulator CheY
MDVQPITNTTQIKPATAARILIADDDPSSRELLRSILEGCGYEVVEAEDGVQVMEKAPHFAPDLVILDIQMPKMDGLEAAKALRGIPSFEKTPIVALTAASSRLLPADISQTGFTRYLIKPIGPAKLRECISDLL